MENTITTNAGEMSLYDYNLLKKEQRRLKSYYTRQIHSYENLSPRIAGEKQIGTFQTLGDEYLQQLERRRLYLNKDITKLDKDHLEYFIESLKNGAYLEERAKNYYSNYIDEMYTKLGYSIGYDKEKLEYVQKKLKSLTPQQFDKARRVDSALQTVEDLRARLPEHLYRRAGGHLCRLGLPGTIQCKNSRSEQHRVLLRLAALLHAYDA